ncbi:ABC transporter substrate-binding protein [Candidatus Leptofilum sp.]|uniref:ABC transporter substrate-binding protein n=1 Tax=Candidatus Leptofilum sp. TaxID=3241576 RepID=UPI003B5BDC0A
MKTTNRNWPIIQLAIIFTIFPILVIACEQEPEPIRIGVVNYLPAMDQVFVGFKQGMQDDFGYEEDVDVIYVYDGPAPTTDDLLPVAENLVNEEVDLILAFSTVASIATKEAIEGTDIPVIFAPVTDPEGSGLVGEGINMTGITNGGSDRKRMEWVVDIIPDAEVIFVPYNPNPSAVSALAEVREAAEELDLVLIERPVDEDEDMLKVLDDMPEEADVIFILPDIITLAEVPTFYQATINDNIPIVSVVTASVEEGALFSFGIDFNAAGHQAARMADQILRGNSTVNDLPVEPTDFFLDINLETADLIGLEIPDEILEQARQIYRASE